MAARLHSTSIALVLLCLCPAATGQSATGSVDLQHRYPSVLMSYLYVEPWEVRHEVLASVPALATWMDLGLRDDKYIEADELDRLQARIAALLRERNPVWIDGRVPEPVQVHTTLVRTGPQRIGQIDRPQRPELATATVGVILSYATDGIPQQVSLDWGMFSDQLQRVPVTAIDPSGPRMTFVTPDAPEFTWRNTLRNYELPDARQVPIPDSISKLQIPVGTVLCVLAMLPAGWQIYVRRRLGRTALGPGVVMVLLTSGALFSWAYSPTYTVSRPAFLVTAPDDEQAVMLLQSLLKNIYRSCNLSPETAVYDRLALTVSRDLQDDVYRQLCRSAAVPEAGGSPGRITQWMNV